MLDQKNKTTTRTLLFINGRNGGYGGQSNWGGIHQPADTPQTLVLEGAETTYDELRISDVPRYWEDFTPPPRDKEFAVDEHTRALFHFNGSVQGESHGPSG